MAYHAAKTYPSIPAAEKDLTAWGYKLAPNGKRYERGNETELQWLYLTECKGGGFILVRN